MHLLTALQAWHIPLQIVLSLAFASLIYVKPAFTIRAFGCLTLFLQLIALKAERVLATFSATQLTIHIFLSP